MTPPNTLAGAVVSEGDLRLLPNEQAFSKVGGEELPERSGSTLSKQNSPTFKD
jgi:hypothetical protein